jgi:ABC-type transport system substrate-binding protein
MGTLNRRAFITSAVGVLGVSLLAARARGAWCAAAAATSAAKPARPAQRLAPQRLGGRGGRRPDSRSGGSLRLSFVGDITNVDGHYYSPKFGPLHYLRHATAYDDNRTATAQPKAEHRAMRQITLNLRKGVTFHPREMTADDVIYNMNRVLDRSSRLGLTVHRRRPSRRATSPRLWSRRSSRGQRCSIGCRC